MAEIYRTKSNAGKVLHMPSGYAVITLKGYQNALSFCDEKGPHLEPSAIMETISYKDGVIYIGGEELPQDDVKWYITAYQHENIDLVSLRCIFSFILGNDKSSWMEQKPMVIYIPDLCRFVGKPKPNSDEIRAILSGIRYFCYVFGVLDGVYLPVLTDYEYDPEKNTISFKAPYLCELIKSIEKARRRPLDGGRKTGGKAKKRTGTRAAYSYLIHPQIRNERNRKAVEIVHIVTTLIEQKGSFGRCPAHISAQTIIDRIPSFRTVLENEDPSNRNKEIKKVFKKAWELLHVYTDLESVYRDIDLPEPVDECIPKWSDRTMVFEFKHLGKIRKPKLTKEPKEYVAKESEIERDAEFEAEPEME